MIRRALEGLALFAAIVNVSSVIEQWLRYRGVRRKYRPQMARDALACIREERTP